MSRQYSNRSYIPFYHSMSSDYTSRRYRPSVQNHFSHIQYLPHRQTFLLNHNANRLTTTPSNPYRQFDNASATSIGHHAQQFDYDSEIHNEVRRRPCRHNTHTKRHQRSSTAATQSISQTNHQPHRHEQKRSRQDESQQEQNNRSSNHRYSSYNTNHRPRQSQPTTNPTARYVPSFARSSNYRSNNHSIQTPRYIHQQPLPVTPNHYRNGITFESQFHRTLMTTHIHQRLSSPFILNDLLHRVTDAQAASYNHSYVHYQPTYDTIAYAWMSSNHEVFSLPTTFTVQFGDFFDLSIPDETPVVGLTDSELEKIPTIIYKNTSTNIKADDKCAICLSEYIIDEKLKCLRCKHCFHSECIDPWLKTSTRCPICRGDQTK